MGMRRQEAIVGIIGAQNHQSDLIRIKRAAACSSLVECCCSMFIRGRAIAGAGAAGGVPIGLFADKL